MSIDQSQKKSTKENAIVSSCKVKSLPFPVIDMLVDAADGNQFDTSIMASLQKELTQADGNLVKHHTQDYVPDPANTHGKASVQTDTGQSSSNIHLAYIVTTLSGELSAESKNKEKSDDEGGTLKWIKVISLYMGSLSLLGLGAYYVFKQDEKESVEEAVTTINGTVVLGPVIEGNGLSVEIISLEGVFLGKADVDAGGFYRATIPAHYDTVKIQVIDKNAEHDYLDESTGLTKDLDSPLFSIVSLNSQQVTANINPLTTLAARLMGLDEYGFGQDVTQEKIQTAYTQVAEHLLGDASYDLVGGEVRAMIDVADQLLQANPAGKVLAMMSGIEDKKSMSTGEMIETLLRGFTEAESGELDTQTARMLLHEGAKQVAFNRQNEALEVELNAHLDKTDQHIFLHHVSEQDDLLLSRHSAISINEDATHIFSPEDFSFITPEEGSELESISFSRLPIDGYLRFDGSLVDESGFTVAIKDIDHLTYKGRANASGDQYAYMQFSTKGAETENSEHGLEFNINPVNDKPVIEVTPQIDALLTAKSALGNNAQSPALVSMADNKFLSLWVEGGKNVIAQTYIHSEDVLIPQGEPYTPISYPYQSNQTLLNPLVHVTHHGQIVLSWLLYDEDAGTSAWLQFFDQTLTPLSQAVLLGDTLYPQSLISLAGGEVALGYVTSGADAHFAVNLYDADAQLIKVIDVADAYAWGGNLIVLSALPSGGLMAGFKSVDDEVGKSGLLQYSVQGERLSQADLVPDALSLYADKMALITVGDSRSALFHQVANDILYHIVDAGAAFLSSHPVNPTHKGIITDWQVERTPDDGFFVAWATTKGEQTSLWGRFFSSDDKPLSKPVEINTWDEPHHVRDLSMTALADGSLHLAWYSRLDSGGEISLASLKTHLFQHAVKDGAAVATVIATDVDSDVVSLDLVDDAKVYFELESDTGVVRIKDAEGIATASHSDFTLQLLAVDDEGGTTNMDYPLHFPINPQHIPSEKMLYVLSLDAAKEKDALDFDDYTVSQLLEMGLLMPATEVNMSFPDTVLHAPAENNELPSEALYIQSDMPYSHFYQYEVLG